MQIEKNSITWREVVTQKIQRRFKPAIFIVVLFTFGRGLGIFILAQAGVSLPKQQTPFLLGFFAVVIFVFSEEIFLCRWKWTMIQLQEKFGISPEDIVTANMIGTTYIGRKSTWLKLPSARILFRFNLWRPILNISIYCIFYYLLTICADKTINHNVVSEILFFVVGSLFEFVICCFICIPLIKSEYYKTISIMWLDVLGD